MKNQPINLSFLFFILFPPYFLNAQAIYNGHIQDVGTQKAIIGAKVQLLNSSIEQTSNYFGDFLIKNTGIDSLSRPTNSYRFHNNSMIWSGELDIALKIFSVNGQIVDTQNHLGNSGSYLFPNFPVGMYILQVETQNNTQSFRAFSNGLRTVIADKEAVWHRSSVHEMPDTLLISKTGYYSRTIPLKGEDTLITINLLNSNTDNKKLHYFNELIDPIAFELVSSLPSRSNDGGVSSVKIIYNIDDGLMYYMNTKLYEFHFDFAQKQLGFQTGKQCVQSNPIPRKQQPLFVSCQSELLQSILDKYVIYLVSANEMPCEKIKLLYDQIVATSYLERQALFVCQSAWNSMTAMFFID